MIIALLYHQVIYHAQCHALLGLFTQAQLEASQDEDVSVVFAGCLSFFLRGVEVISMDFPYTSTIGTNASLSV